MRAGHHFTRLAPNSPPKNPSRRCDQNFQRGRDLMVRMKTVRNAAALAVLSALVAACGGGGGGSDSAATAASATPPVIASHPTSVSVLTDGTAMFTVSATGSSLSYHWQK